MPRQNTQYRFFVPASATPYLLDEVWRMIGHLSVPLPDWNHLLQLLSQAYAFDREMYAKNVGDRLHRFPTLKSLQYTRRATSLARKLDEGKGDGVKELLEKLMTVRAQVGVPIFLNAILHSDAVRILTDSLSAWAYGAWDPQAYGYKDPLQAADRFLKYAKALATKQHLMAIEGRLAA